MKELLVDIKGLENCEFWLAKALDAINDVDDTDELYELISELQGFDLLTILNKPCQLQIIKEEKNGNTYNNISAIMSLPKGSSVELLSNTCHFDIEDSETWDVWKKIPTWIQEKIKKAINYTDSGLDKYIEQIENSSDDESLQSLSPDDLPL